MKKYTQAFLFFSIITLLLQACSSAGFHLRKSTPLADMYKTIALQGIAKDSDLYITLAEAMVNAGGSIVPLALANSTIIISNLKEDKQIIAYTSKRVAREYRVYLRFNYQIKANKKIKKYLIRLDKTLIYDSNFVLGKAEEEKRIQQSLREEAARLILLRLRHK
jgi:outer membrane lipopolysaccharide assembly protein LptE/RlpB